MNKYLCRAKLKEIRDAAKDPAGRSDRNSDGTSWHTTPKNALFYTVTLKGAASSLKMVFRRWDLYVHGFVNQNGSFTFTDGTWNVEASNMGFTSDYTSMGWDRISPYKKFTFDDINTAIDSLASCKKPENWKANKQAIVKLVIAFIEGARMHSIQALVEGCQDIGSVKWDESKNVLALRKG